MPFFPLGIISGGGSGTVTSFSSGDLSPLFTTSVATATTTPAMSFALLTQTANRIFSGPATGANAAPSFRSLVAADIPDLSGVYQPLDSALTALSTGSDFVVFTGPATSNKTFTLPNASATILTDNSAVAVAQGGTGITSYAEGDLLYGNSGGTLSKLTEPGLPGYVLSASGGAPSWVQLSTLTATTITGTANQVLVNGTSGSGQTGPVTLTLPQNIHTGATPQFSELGLGRAAEAGIPLSVQGGAATLVFVTGYGATSSSLPTISLRASAGTSGAPTASQSGDSLGGINMRGYGATGFAGSSRAGIFSYATENWTDSIQGARMSFETTPNGSTTRRRVLDVSQNADILMTVGSFDFQGDVSQYGRGLFIQREGNCQTNLLAVGPGQSATYDGGAAGGSFGAITATPSGCGVRHRSRFYDGTNWFISGGSLILTTEAQTATNRGCSYIIDTILTGTTTLETRLQITGSGSIAAGTQAALATTATDGFLYIPTCAGTPTGVPTAVSGLAPLVVDTTNNKLYFYSGGSWRDAGP